MLLKGTVEHISPLLQIALRSGIAAVLVVFLILARGERVSVRGGPWRAGLAVGALFALEFLLLGEGLRHTSASHMVVFLYTAPIFAAIGLHWKLPAERLRPVQWGGILVAFLGIVLAFVGRGAGANPGAGLSASMLWGDLLGLLAGAAWGATTVTVRCTRLASAPASETLLYQLVAAFVLLTPVAILTGQATFHQNAVAWGSLLFQGVVISFASFLLWFWMLRHYLASRLGVFSFMTPIFGVTFGVWFLGEKVEPGFLVGAGLVMAGIVLVSGHEVVRQALRPSGQTRRRGRLK